MGHPFSFNQQIMSTFGMIFAASAVIILRLRAAKKPVTIKKILIPPVGMSTGFFMFLSPQMRIPLEWAMIAFLVGALCFSYPLIRTSVFQRVGDAVYLQRSKAFVFILLGLLVIRIVLHGYVESYITVLQTGAVFFMLAFGMLLPWRLVMYYRFRSLKLHADSEKA